MSTIEATLPPLFDAPDGWEWTTLGEIGTWTGGGTPKKGTPEYWDGGTVPWISPKDMKQPVLTDSADHITEQATTETSAKLRAAHSVAFVTRSGILEHSLPVAYVPVEAAYNQDMKVLTPYEDVDARFIALYCRAYAHEILHGCRKDGTTVASIDLAKLTAFPFPKAPLPEQQELVAAHAAHDSTLAKALEAISTAARQHVGFAPSLLRREFTNSAWNFEPLGDLADLVSGLTKGRKTNDPVSERAFLRAANVQAGRLDLNEIKTYPCTTAEFERYRLVAGDVLLVEGSGSRRRIGEGWLWSGDIPDCIHQNHVFRARLDPEILLPEFFAFYLAAASARAYFWGQAKTTSGLNTLSKAQLSGLPVPVPSLDEQHETLARVKAGMDLSVRLGAEIGLAGDRADGLRQSLMRAAASGSLTVSA